MTSTSFHVLFESASGYALFSVLEGEEIGALLNEVQAGMSDFSRFQRVVKMTAFSPFDTAEEALENINAVTEHEMTDVLKVRLANRVYFVYFSFPSTDLSHTQPPRNATTVFLRIEPIKRKEDIKKPSGCSRTSPRHSHSRKSRRSLPLRRVD